MKTTKRMLRLHYIIGAVAAVLFVVGAFFPDKVSALMKAQEMPLSDERVVQLGDVPVGKTTTRQISLFNPHISPVALKNVGTSCGCTVVKDVATSIAPFHSSSISVSVTPRHKGEGNETVDLNTSHGPQQVSIEFNAV